LSSSSSEVLCLQSWGQTWSFGQIKCSCTIMLKERPGCFNNLFHVRNVSYGGYLLDWRWDFIFVARRFWLPCHISQQSWTLADIYNFLFSTAFNISKGFCEFLVFNAAWSHTTMLIQAPTHCLTMTFSRRVSPVVFVCLHPITCRPREILASTLTPYGMIEYMSPATLEWSAYFECVFSCWCHPWVISGIQNVLLFPNGLEW
jgi:hypothetical protein